MGGHLRDSQWIQKILGDTKQKLGAQVLVGPGSNSTVPIVISNSRDPTGTVDIHADQNLPNCFFFHLKN